MKRYMLFCHDDYYPYGGLDDCKCSFDSLDEMRQAIDGDGSRWKKYDNVYAFDRVEGVEIQVK